MTHLSSITDNKTVLNELVTYGYDCPIPLGTFLEGYLLEGGKYYFPENFLAVPSQTVFDYSNVGVSLLAHIVENISGRDFEEYCQQFIFEPLGMEQTSFLLEALDQSLIAIPYLQQNDTLVPCLHPGFPV
jgi:CubicO group peptidase (beta-lactamase class C family)